MAVSNSNTSNEIYRSTVRSAEHGFFYQRFLFLTIFERLTINRRVFRLAFEMTDARLFDDIVVFLKSSDNDSEEQWCFQVVHMDASEGCKKKSITYTNLFPTTTKSRANEKFSLYKYLVSFIIMQEKDRRDKKVCIVTNRELSLETFKKNEISIVHQEVDEIFKLQKGGEYIGLKLSEELVDEMMKNVRDSMSTYPCLKTFFQLRDAIIELFQSGVVEKIIYKYKTPLNEVLEKIDNSVIFKSTFVSVPNIPHLSNLYSALIEKDFDVESAKLIISVKNEKQISSIFSGESKKNNCNLPLSIRFPDKKTVEKFFDSLILFVKQPDDLRPIINDDFQAWMKTWLRPQYFGKLNKELLDKPINKLNAKFGYVPVQRNQKKYLSLSDGEKCLAEIKDAQDFKQKTFCPFYINRRFGEFRSSSASKIKDDDFAEKLTDHFANQRIILLSAQPGTGKTTVFEYVANKAQQKTDRLVYLIYLNELHVKLRSEFNNINSLEEALLPFKIILSEAQYDKIKDAIEKTDKQIILFFDAFDEITAGTAKEQQEGEAIRDKVINIIKQLITKENVQIVINGRRHIKTMLEKKFSIRALTLVPLNKTDQINFLKQFWKVKESDETRFKAFVEELFQNFSFNKNRSLFIPICGLSLTLRMLAEVNINVFKQYLNTGYSDENSFKKIAGIAGLFEEFIESSFKHKMTKFGEFSDPKQAKEIYDEARKKFIEEHQFLALSRLMPQTLNDSSFKINSDSFLERIRDQREKSPLVELVNNQIKFVHSSYAEFLVARYVYSNFEKFRDDIFLTSSECLQRNPLGISEMVRDFFFDILETKQDTKYLHLLKDSFQKDRGLRKWIFQACGYDTIVKLLKDTKQEWVQNVIIEAIPYTKVFKFLITKHEFDTEYKSSEGDTVILAASGYISVENMTILIDKGANINRIDKLGRTPLCRAIEKCNWEVAEYLIERKADLKTGNLPKTALHTAFSCMKEFTSIYKYNSTTKKNIKACKSFKKIFEMVIKTMNDVDCYEPEYKRTLLNSASSYGFEEAVSVLLNNSANVYVKDIIGNTPLHWAVYSKNINVAKLLLEKSADVKAANRDGVTPLNLAVKVGHIEMVKLFLEKLVKNVNVNEQTHLHLAAQNGLADVVELLLEHNVNLNAADTNRHTPLHVVALNGSCDADVKVVQLLLNKGANLRCKNIYNQTPIHIAMSRMIKCKQTMPKNCCTDVIEACTNIFDCLSKMLTLMIKNLDDVDFDFSNGRTMLQYASEKGLEDVVSLLQNRSANVDFVSLLSSDSDSD